MAIKIERVEPGSEAEALGLAPGDELLAGSTRSILIANASTTFVQTEQEGEGIAPSPSVHNTIMPPITRKLGLLDDFLALVVTAVATCLVGELQRAAVAALDQCGGLQLPNIAATLVAAGLGKMSLRYCHIFAPP